MATLIQGIRDGQQEGVYKLASAKAEQGSQEQLLAELERMAFQDKEQEDDVFLSYAGAAELTAELAWFLKVCDVSCPITVIL